MSIMKNITDTIVHFRKYLLVIWDDIDNLMSHHDWEDDGYFIHNILQANWELLVEKQLLEPNEILTPYSSYYGSKPVLHKNGVPTHRVICKVKDDRQLYSIPHKKLIPENSTLIFRILLRAFKEGSDGLYPPFDAVDLITADHKHLCCVPLSDVTFYLEKIPNNDIKSA